MCLSFNVCVCVCVCVRACVCQRAGLSVCGFSVGENQREVEGGDRIVQPCDQSVYKQNCPNCQSFQWPPAGRLPLIRANTNRQLARWTCKPSYRTREKHTGGPQLNATDRKRKTAKFVCACVHVCVCACVRVCARVRVLLCVCLFWRVGGGGGGQVRVRCGRVCVGLSFVGHSDCYSC